MIRKFIHSVLFLLTLTLFTFPLHAASVHLDKVHSATMDKDIDLICICPDQMDEGIACPVLYLLHGYGGNQTSWLVIKPELPRLADQYGIMFVMADAKNSWYWDSPVQSGSRYETFMTEELISYVDSRYKTLADRNFRAIAGLSMGGHGSMWLAIRHQDLYGACGSMSGGLDIRPFPDNWEMKAQLGELEQNRERWDDYTVINLLDQLEDGALDIIFDCGTEDFFYQVNLDVHNKLLDKKIKHDYIARPGVHNAEYWANSLEYQLLFFNNFFNKNR